MIDVGFATVCAYVFAGAGILAAAGSVVSRDRWQAGALMGCAVLGTGAGGFFFGLLDEIARHVG